MDDASVPDTRHFVDRFDNIDIAVGAESFALEFKTGLASPFGIYFIAAENTRGTHTADSGAHSSRPRSVRGRDALDIYARG